MRLCPYTTRRCRCVEGSVMHRACAYEADRTGHYATRLYKKHERGREAAAAKKRAA